MKITVEMTEQEFTEFLEYRNDKQKFAHTELVLRDDLKMMARKISWAIEPNPKKPGKYEIADQDHMDDLWMLSGEYAE